MAIFFPRSIGPVFIDVVVSEDFEASSEIPEHPVERGAKLVDHVWENAEKLTMECLTENMTDTLRALRDLKAQAEPFDILTGFDLFEDMLIENIHAHRDVVWSTILSVSVTFKHANIVDTAEGAGNGGTGGDPRGQGKTARGQVQARKVDVSSGRGAAVRSGLPAAR